MNLCDIKTIKQTMAMFSINFRKEFGQNFLTDNLVVEDIADNCCDSNTKTILEIGPGIGSLTKVINEDVMKCDLNSLLAPYFEKGGVSVCANLPYYITTPILMMLLESNLPFDYITVMIQEEVADRLCAAPGGKACGAITAVLNYYGTPEKLFTVRSDRFIPEPKVDSAVVRIKLHKDKPYKPLNEDIFFKTIRGAFEQRRKTLPNSLSSVFTELSKAEINDIILDCGHDLNIRGERLSMSDLCLLADKLYAKINN